MAKISEDKGYYELNLIIKYEARSAKHAFFSCEIAKFKVILWDRIDSPLTQHTLLLMSAVWYRK